MYALYLNSRQASCINETHLFHATRSGVLSGTGMRIFNHLPTNVKQLANKKELFKSALKRYLLLQSFYSLDEYLNYSGQ
jgi:hypothetical protein